MGQDALVVVSPRRQTIPVEEVRAPPVIDDQMTAGEVREAAGHLGSLQDLLNVVASQVRIISGANAWLEAPPPGATSSFTGELVSGERLNGPYDGEAAIYRTARPYLPGTLTLCFNGSALTWGEEADYVTIETSGAGTGFDAIRLTGMVAPRSRDVLLATYVRTV